MKIKQTFIDYIRYERKLSVHTYQAYQYDLEEYLKFKKNCKIKSDHWLQYTIFLVEKKFSKKTQQRKKSVVKQYYKFLLQEEIIQKKPIFFETQKLKETKIPKSLSQKQINDLLDQIKTDNTLKSVRNKAMLELCYSSGLRVSELATLKWISLKQNFQLLKVIGKRNKQRLIPIGKTAQIALKNYADLLFREKINTSNGYLFINHQGKPLTRQTIYNLIKKYGEKVGLKVHPHQFRHSFATHILEEGGAIRDVQLLLGHKDIATTQIYTTMSNKKIKEIYNQTHPRAGGNKC